MKLSEAATLGLLALGACTEPAPAPQPKREAPVAPAAPVVDIYPKSELLHQELEFPVPEELEMSPEEFERFVKGLGQEFAKQYKASFAKKTVEERGRNEEMNSTIEGFIRHLNRKSGGKFNKAFQKQFPGENPKVDMVKLTQLLNQLFHAEGSHLQLKKENGAWLAEIYRFQETDAVAIHDHLGSAEYPVLYMTETLIRRFPPALAEADANSMTIQFYENHLSAEALELIGELGVYPNFSHADRARLGQELKKDTLHHEAVHLLLHSRDRALRDYQGCVRERVAFVAEAMVFNTEGCFTSRQIQELCGFSAELEHSPYAGPWTQMGVLGLSIGTDDPNYLFITTLPHYTFNTLPVADQATIAEASRKTGERFQTSLLRTRVGQSTTMLAKTQAVGRQGYKDCLRLTEQLRAEVKRAAN
jgi:hypothetical protein